MDGNVLYPNLCFRCWVAICIRLFAVTIQNDLLFEYVVFKLPLLILGGGVPSIWKNNMIWVTLRDFYARVLTDIPSSWQYVSQGSTKIIEWCLLLLKKKNYFVFTLQHIFNWWVMSHVTSIRLFFLFFLVFIHVWLNLNALFFAPIVLSFLKFE